MDAPKRSNTILVVDDEPLVRETIERYLTLQHYDVVTAADGTTALAHAASRRPALILLDVVMPGLDGFTVLARLKSQDATKHIPVVMLTGHGETSNIFLSQDLRAVDYVIKPFTLPELLEVIRRHVF